jgi:ABC-type lipoprotein export system ATPase subunit
MADEAPLLRLTKVSREFPDANGGAALAVLRDISVDFSRGESVAIIGPSGSGKSTLLNIIGTLDQPTSGTVNFEGQELATLNEDEQALLRNREMGFIFQSHHLLPQCTVTENVLVPALARNAPTTGTEQRARQLLNRVGLGERLTHRPGQLSGGERQRVAVVRALINRPKLLLADEPTGSLDRASAENLGQLLVDLNQEEEITLITVTHSVELAGHMGRTLELKDGQFL